MNGPGNIPEGPDSRQRVFPVVDPLGLRGRRGLGVEARGLLRRAPGETDAAVLLDRDGGEVQWEIDLPGALDAPIHAGDAIGTLTVKNDNATAAEIAILAPEDIEALTIWDLWWRILTA